MRRSGYRVYTQKDVETLRFIRRNRASADVKQVALGHVAELEAKMRLAAHEPV